MSDNGERKYKATSGIIGIQQHARSLTSKTAPNDEELILQLETLTAKYKERLNKFGHLQSS